MEILPKILVENHEPADAKRGEQKRNREAGGIDGEEQHTACYGVAASGEKKHSTEDRADARSPAESEGEAEEEAAPDTGLRGFATEVDVTIEPAGHSGTEKTDEREREKMRSAQAGK